MKIFFASDHAGFSYKSQLMELLKKDLGLLEQALIRGLEAQNPSTPKASKIELVDLGVHSTDSVDYPDFADGLCVKIKDNSTAQARGVLICGSGIGMSIRANRYPWVRAALVHSAELTRLAREHNDANVLCLGARFTEVATAKEWVEIFLKTPFSGGRHEHRVQKLGSKIHG